MRSPNKFIINLEKTDLHIIRSIVFIIGEHKIEARGATFSAGEAGHIGLERTQNFFGRPMHSIDFRTQCNLAKSWTTSDGYGQCKSAAMNDKYIKCPERTTVSINIDWHVSLQWG